MKQMVEIYIKLAELETKRKDTNKKVTLPREIRSVQQLDLVPSYIGSYCNRMLLNDVTNLKISDLHTLLVYLDPPVIYWIVVAFLLATMI
ncbi:uncharacterized protein LOC114321207 isoform X2 [Camellia sinensis]|uniref:uncharacterized protein LOC114321207 isoform X2 n=1 Tax=Camellia sinensis TaxID=4442 RepID=UPI001035550C|nr:uncharacterized protein LOC114321207 isoform X2 [Camellia sinensis]